MSKRRIISLNVNPGQPTDGGGVVCIHLFVPDENGPFVEPQGLHEGPGETEAERKQLIAKPTRGRLACNPKRSAVPVTRNGVTTITPRTDDPRAVTCPRCLASQLYVEAMEQVPKDDQLALYNRQAQE